MTQIVLTTEQTELLANASQPVVVVDASGRQFTLSPRALWSPAELAEMEGWLDSGEAGISFDQVMSKMRSPE